MAKSIHRVSLFVDRVVQLDNAVRVYHLKDKDNWDLPPFTAGAHIDVHLPSGKIRQYSLCGNPGTTNEYNIAVQRDEAGRGGSVEMHESVGAGQELLVSLPRNTFPIRTDIPSIMIAGGIGITPFLSALPGLKKQQQNFHIHYCVQSLNVAAFAGWIDESGLQANMSLHSSNDGNRLDIEKLITEMEPGTHVYCCGPWRMIEACEAHGDSLGERLHVEHFAVNPGVDPAYEIKLAKVGRVIPVAAGQSMLQALRMADIDVPASCEGGICLECKCKWLEGNPVHRELTMPKDDRKQWITPCVSGCDGGSITLDL